MRSRVKRPHGCSPTLQHRGSAASGSMEHLRVVLREEGIRP